MTLSSTFVSAAEAAYIAGLSDRQLHRVFDEHIVPNTLTVRGDNGRRFARLAAAFADFYFCTEPHFNASLRREVLAVLTKRVEGLSNKEAVLALTAAPENLDWHFDLPFANIDLAGFIGRAAERARHVDRADAYVSVDADTMGGSPVFSGTRVPLDTVLASLDAGIEFARLKEAYPFLSDEHVEAARVYVEVHPPRGRPRRLAESHPGWTLKASQVVRQARAS